MRACARAGADLGVWASQPPACRSGPGPSACQPWPTVQHPEQNHPWSLTLQIPEPWPRPEDTWPAPGLAGGKYFSRLRLKNGAALAMGLVPSGPGEALPKPSSSGPGLESGLGGLERHLHSRKPPLSQLWNEFWEEKWTHVVQTQNGMLPPTPQEGCL